MSPILQSSSVLHHTQGSFYFHSNSSNKQASSKSHLHSHQSAMSSNPAQINLPANSNIFLSCRANAAWDQRVTITIGNQVIGVFNGKGEDVPMTLANGQTVLPLPLLLDDRTCLAKFEYIEGGVTRISKVANPVVTGDNRMRSISINAIENNTDDNIDSQLKVDIQYPDPTNPTNLVLPKNAEIQLSCLSNAAYTQRVALTVQDEPAPILFSGSGENFPMTANGKNYYNLSPSSKDRTLVAVFSFVQSASTRASKVQPPVEVGDARIRITSVSSEDGVDVDKNDSVLRVVAIIAN